MIAELARAAEDQRPGAVDHLRAALLAELDRAGTTVGLLDEFELPAELRPNWIGSIRAEEDYMRIDRPLLSLLLLRTFMGLAYWERRFRALNTGRVGAST